MSAGSRVVAGCITMPGVIGLEGQPASEPACSLVLQAEHLVQ